MDNPSLLSNWSKAALAFRGYNVENLGRTHELLADARYGPLVRSELERGSEHASRLLRRDVDLPGLVERRQEPTLEQYGEAVALILSVSIAQLRCLEEVHQAPWRRSQLLLGYSLGEISALVAGGTLSQADALLAPLTLADDCVSLATDMQLAVMFSRRTPLDWRLAQLAVLETNMELDGVVGVSAVLSPNSLLVMGQGSTLERLLRRIQANAKERVHLRRNPHSWPPMHTPIVWQRNIPCRAAQLMLSMRGGLTPPSPPVLSLVTGKVSYTDVNVRETLYRWTDQTQHLWPALYELLAAGVETVVHVGPLPNIIPATLRRLSENVEAQMRGSLGVRTVARLVRRPWLQAMLPNRTALLRAPLVRQIVLEDWLLEH